MWQQLITHTHILGVRSESISRREGRRSGDMEKMDEVGSGEEDTSTPHGSPPKLFPRTFSTSALRIKGKFSFWERLHSSPTGGRFGASYGIGPGLVSGYVMFIAAEQSAHTLTHRHTHRSHS